MGPILNVSSIYFIHCNAAVQKRPNDGLLIIFLITPAGFWPDEVPDKSVTSRYRYNLTRFVWLSATSLMAEPRTNRRLRTACFLRFLQSRTTFRSRTPSDSLKDRSSRSDAAANCRHQRWRAGRSPGRCAYVRRSDAPPSDGLGRRPCDAGWGFPMGFRRRV